jgi:hypothetical protein
VPDWFSAYTVTKGLLYVSGRAVRLVKIARKGEERISVQNMMINAVDPDGKWLYRTGGISALALGIAYIVIIALYVPIGAPPSGTEARLAYLAGNRTVWWAILGLSVLTDFLFVPVALSLYVALKGFNRNAMLLATACVALFIVLDLAITWTNLRRAHHSQQQVRHSRERRSEGGRRPGRKLPVRSAGIQALICLQHTHARPRDFHDRVCHAKGNLQ